MIPSATIARNSASPHTRGWTPPLAERVPLHLGFPAHAGMDLGVEAQRAGSVRLPRTRGDGPTGSGTAATSAPASPHTRGWTRHGRPAALEDLGFPAHAGMDRVNDMLVDQMSRLPRTRGDGPGPLVGREARARASPHTRGWTPPTRHAPGRATGFPAHAGMDPGTATGTPCSSGLPRTRGDGPDPTRSLRTMCPASPHTRGWTRPAAVDDRRLGGFPAHAGMDPLERGEQARRLRLPRTRGDGPGVDRLRRGAPAASPHTRGWTVGVVAPDAERGGFPAHAGMDPPCGRTRFVAPRLPRTRGDGPRLSDGTLISRRASPHTRGWTVHPHGDGLGVQGFPAHAGMDRQDTLATSVSPRLPRTRGDGPAVRGVGARLEPASPHTRGWTWELRAASRAAGGFPAHAGMDPASPGRSRFAWRLPRTRGDGPSSLSAASYIEQASPHTRGWTPDDFRQIFPECGFPAHAGMDPSRSISGGRSRRLPRTRGDGPGPDRGRGRHTPASPHTRGWTRASDRRRRPDRGFPAHAGMDPLWALLSRVEIGLPRTRGDGPRRIHGVLRTAQASPHTRGWTLDNRGVGHVAVGFPAHAGMDPERPADPARGARLPRTRGDGPQASTHGAASSAASPHTRGWTPGLEAPRVSGQGFPAHAGMDPIIRTVSNRTLRLPRTRGDGPWKQAAGFLAGGASPHTRGWTVGGDARTTGHRGFPAHAGMDPSPCRADRPAPRLPRTRGDGPFALACTAGAAAGFPAHAGVRRQ